VLSNNEPHAGRCLPRTALPWFSLALVWLSFELPPLLALGVLQLSTLRFALELPLLLTLAGFQHAYGGTWSRRGLVLLAALLLTFRSDQALCWLLMRDEPLLYDQWFMARHLWVLLGDLMSVRTLAVLLAVGLLGWLTTLGVRRLLRHGGVLLAPERRQSTLRGAVLFWSFALLVRLVSPVNGGVLVWLTPSVIDNVRRSREVYRSVQSTTQTSPHAHYGTVVLRDKPDVLLFIVESYGRLLFVDEGTGAAHATLLRTLERALSDSGWHAASGFSTSTVSGGRSWIAEGTMLMGIPIAYESVFQHLIGLRPQPPHLVSFLRRQGYRGVLLAPSDRNRPGAYVVNRYGFDTLLTYEELGYRGPSIGWGLVPDQYSLAIAAQRVLPPRAERAAPVFLDFHMVSSHAPWREVPRLTDDPTTHASRTEPVERGGTPEGTVLTRLGRYDRGAERRFAWMEQFDGPMRRGYQATIDYDLRVITRYLSQRGDDALVIVLGDHQPPVIARADQSFDAPVHVLSRDPRRLQSVLGRGFLAGLTIVPNAQPVMTHADVFPLVVDALRQQPQ